MRESHGSKFFFLLCYQLVREQEEWIFYVGELSLLITLGQHALVAKRNASSTNISPPHVKSVFVRVKLVEALFVGLEKLF